MICSPDQMLYLFFKRALFGEGSFGKRLYIRVNLRFAGPHGLIASRWGGGGGGDHPPPGFPLGGGGVFFFRTNFRSLFEKDP